MELFFLCLKIFCVRICDVSLGTIKTNYAVRGNTLTSGIIAFFEVFLWFIIVREALNTDINSLWVVISYAGGYATGTIIGTYLSTKLINTNITVEVVTSLKNFHKIKKIREAGYELSIIETKEESNHQSLILFITLKKRYLEELKNIIDKIDKQASIIINEAKIIQNRAIK